MTNTDSCGVIRLSIPSARFTVSSRVMIGSASMSPLRKIMPPARVSARNALLLMGSPPIGSVWKVSTSSEISHRCPLNTRNSNMANISRMRASIGILRLLPGSTKVANDRPICRPIISPQVRMAAKANCIVKPSAMPMRICWSASHSALAEKSGTSTGGSEGAITKVMMIPNPTFTRLGTERSLRIGAVVISASTRSSGQK